MPKGYKWGHHTEESKRKIGESNRISLKRYWERHYQKYPEKLLKYIFKNPQGFQKGHPTFKGCEKGWFKKGHVPWTKGKKGYKNAGSFKKGHVPHPINKVALEKLRKRMIENNPMSNPKIRKKCIRNAIKASFRRPNKMEKQTDKIIKSVTKDYKYVGDGKAIINNKIPDWINVNGQKKVILFNGNYYHLKRKNISSKEEAETKERKPYNDFGFKVLFIWEDELKNTNLIKEKIRCFNET